MLPLNIIFSSDQYCENSTLSGKNLKINLPGNVNYPILQNKNYVMSGIDYPLPYFSPNSYNDLVPNLHYRSSKICNYGLLPQLALESSINYRNLPWDPYSYNSNIKIFNYGLSHQLALNCMNEYQSQYRDVNNQYNIINEQEVSKTSERDYLYKKIDFLDGFNNSFFSEFFPLETINNVLSDQGKHSIRKRLLPANNLVYLVIALNFWREKDISEIFKVVSSGITANYPSFDFNSGFPKQAAISRARTRLGSKVMEELANKTLDWLAPSDMTSAWYKDLRLAALDGTTFDVPDEKINDAYFGRSSTARGYSAYPQARVLALTEIGTRSIYSGLIGRYKDSEVTMAKQLFDKKSKLDSNLLVLADRGFYGYPLWSQFLETGANGLWRVKCNLSTKPLINLSDGSYISYVYDSKNRKKCVPIKVRVINSTINYLDENGNQVSENYKFITNLFDHVKYPAKELAELYHRRWEIEIGFKEIKSNLLCGNTIRSKTPELVKQEIFGLLLAHFAVSKLICQAAIKKQIQPVEISFKQTINCIHRMLPNVIALHPLQIPIWKSNLLDQIGNSKCKTNRGRKNKRAIKRKMSAFPVRKPGLPYNLICQATVTINAG